MRLPFVNLFLFIILSLQVPAFGQTFSLLKDINPGTSGTDEFFPINVNGTAFFVADDGVHGSELWKSDGTAAGTTLIKDINPGATSSIRGSLVNVNGVVYFSADNGINGEELWKSDGTEAGTVMVKDIFPGAASSCVFSPNTAISANGLLFFSANNASTGIELWKSDGTEAGTEMIKDINPGVITSGPFTGSPKISNPLNFTAVNGTVFFSAYDDAHGQELWKTDGTTAGTVLVKDILPGTIGSAIRDCINVNGVFYFLAVDGTPGYSYSLWKTDGTAGGTIQLKFMDPSYSFNNWGIAVDNFLYFLDEDGLWKSNGTPAGTVKVKDVSATPKFLTFVNGYIYYVGCDAASGRELWKSDGTTAGTTLVKDINPGSANSDFMGLAKVGNKLVFSVDDGIHGYELWVSDGTESGTRMLQDTEPGSGSAVETAIIEADSKAFAVIHTPAYGNELWVADINAPILLPLNFLEFKGNIVNEDGLLQWKTDNEVKAATFILERSIDGKNYKPVAYVNPSNTSGVHNYNYKDPAITLLGVPLVYYRVKQVDINGKFTYSRIVALSVDNKSNFVMIYPNPVIHDINLTITISQNEKLQWQLIDYSGRVLKNGIYDLSAGSTSVSVDGSNLHAGTYFMKLKGTGLQQVIKVIKQ